MLVACGIFREGDALFVSSDAAALKSTGQLFRHAMRTLRISPHEMHHIGDNEAGDYKAAKRLRIHADLYTRAQLSRFESATLSKLPPSQWRERTLVTASKFTRLSRCEDGPADSAIWDLLSSTIAPFVAGYALWLIEEAHRRGTKKLFFLARDMQLVHEVTSYFVRRKGLNIKCIYVYASRNAWHPAGYSGPQDFELFWLTDNLPANNPETVLSRLLGADGFAGLDSLLGPLVDDNQIWGRNEIRELLESKQLRPVIDQATKEARRVLFRYMNQCGYSPDPSCALVDAGWRGSLQNSLARAFHLEGVEGEILGFYIGLRHVSHVERTCKMIPFLPDDAVNEQGFSLVSLIESLLSANHGSTVGYVTRPGSTEPVLRKDPPDQILRQWNLVRDSCMAYAQELADSPAWEAASGVVSRSALTPLPGPNTGRSRVVYPMVFRWRTRSRGAARSCRPAHSQGFC